MTHLPIDVQRCRKGETFPRSACSADRQWRSARAGYHPTGPCPSASTGAADHWYSRGSRVTRGCADRHRRSGSRGGVRAFVVRPLVALIGGECVPQRGRHVPEFLGEAPSRTRRIRVFQPGHDHQTGRSLHQGADGRPVTRTFASVAFPVGRGTIRVATSAGRSATDIILGIWPRRSAPRTTRLVRLTQDRQQFRSPGPSRQAVQHHRDGLG